MRTVFWLILPLLLLAAPAAAQDDTVVCVGGQHWLASLADSRAIETEPVPASYRLLFESTAPCTRWALDEESIVDWHMRFGSERSMAPALAYLERDYLRDEPAPATFRSVLERAWRAAQPDLRRANRIRQPQGLDYSLRSRFTGASRPIQRIEALLRTREKYVFLAEQHLRAAEEFGSLPFLERAELYVQPAVAAAAFLAPLESQPPVHGIVDFNLHTFRTDDLEMRAALLRARLTRAAGDIARARAVVQARERPHYRRIADTAFSGGQGFCDISRGASDWEQLEATCEEDDDALQERVINHLLASAIWDLVTDAPDRGRQDGSDGRALSLVEVERRSGQPSCCGRRGVDALVRLRLARADHYRRLFVAAAARGAPNDASGSWFEALVDLQAAERLIAPFKAPQRFRRVAEAWLALWAQGGPVQERYVDNQRATDSAELRRYATYLRRQIASLDAIAAGADAGLPPPAN